MLDRRIVSREEVVKILGDQVFKDAVKIGWLKPRSVKRGRRSTKRAKVIYALADVRDVEERILKGEYPQPPAEPASARPDWFGKAKERSIFFTPNCQTKHEEN